ncbi:MAG: TlpA disulfide reductase family protein [Deltaproteobacteria bacterium]|jgi:thiol-disulfide isomerase/thioredoxin|nr:TlpA disulfide reductase family protein [Deltaproteobacteria bacterium]
MHKYLNLTLLLTLILVFPGCKKKQQAVDAPDFEIKSIDKTPCKLSDYQNKLVLLEVWSYNCPHCRKQAKVLNKLADAMKDKVKILSVHSRGGDKARRVVKKLIHNDNIKICLDNGSLYKKLKELKDPHKPRGVPHMAIVKSGKIVQTLRGYKELDVLKNALENHL